MLSKSILFQAAVSQLRNIINPITFFCLFFLFQPAPAFCLQVHGGNEGLYVHQMAHLFFMAAMVFLSYILFRHPLGHGKGWTYLKFSLLFFFIWNINALTTHALELEIPHDAMIQEDLLPHSLCIPLTFKAYIYYIGKFDHLLCVPAMFCLAMALRSFCMEAKEGSLKNKGTTV